MEQFEQQPTPAESVRESSERRKLALYNEFSPQFVDLNNRIISYITEFGLEDDEKINEFEEEGELLRNKFEKRVKEEDVEHRAQFDNQYRGIEITYFDFIRDYDFTRQDKVNEKVKSILDQKPTISILRNKVEELEKKVEPWIQLKRKVTGFVAEYHQNHISDAIDDKKSEFSSLANLLKVEIEKMKEKTGEYTEEDLRIARENVERADEIGMTGNNPNAGRAKQQEARRKLRAIENALKKSGKIEKSEAEKLTEELDRLYPNAKSKTIVEYQGNKYQVRYYPLETSRTGKTVSEWSHKWVLLSEENQKK